MLTAAIDDKNYAFKNWFPDVEVETDAYEPVTKQINTKILQKRESVQQKQTDKSPSFWAIEKE